MSYIAKKKIKGHDYFYLMESKRVNGKVKTRTIKYLGKNKKQAELKLKQMTEKGPKKTEVKKVEQISQRGLIREVFPEAFSQKGSALITVDEMTSFCKRRGFVYQNSEIYGNLAGFWDFGPIGVELKNNIKNNWWKTFINDREDIVGIDGSIITHPKIWEASGHVSEFKDVAVKCKKCKKPNKIDKEEAGKVKCECGGEYEVLGDFNLMFTTNVGPIEKESIKTYLRPETAQLIFTDFRLVQENSRLKLPFGIGQIGKAFRNEISPRDFLFRSREFEQAEIEFFVNPKYKNECPYFKEIENLKINLLSVELQKNNKEHIQTTAKELKKLTTEWHGYWLAEFYQWFIDLGIKPENLRLREHLSSELAHYAGACFDIEYKFPFGWKEIHGNADRQQFDLNQHIKSSNKDLSIYDEESKERIIPYVASEPSQGIERAFLAIMFDAYTYDSERENIVLKLKPSIAPFQIAVFSLVNKLNGQTKELFDELKKDFHAFYDISGSIGRRYFRQDEIGTPYCITYDFDSIKNKDITIRERDTTKQIRVKIKNLKDILKKLINSEIEFEKAGKLIS